MNHFFRPVLKSLKKIVLLLPLFIVLLFMWSSDPEYVEYDGWSALASVFCVVENPADANLLSVLMGLVPYVVFIFVFSQEYREDFVISYCYVFTRYRGRGTWALQKGAQLLLTVVIHVFLLFGGNIIVALCRGYRFPISKEMLGMTLLLYLSVVLSMYLFVLLANVLSLPMGGTRAYFVTVVGYLLLTLGVILTCKPPVWRLGVLVNPAAQAMYFLHSDAVFPELFGRMVHSGMYPFSDIPGFPAVYSLIYLAAAAVIVQAVFIRLLNRKDLISMIGGES